MKYKTSIVLSDPLALVFQLLFALVFFNIIRAQAPDTLWTKTFGGSNNDEGWSVQQTSDSGYVVTGYTNIAGRYDVWLIKTDAHGDTLWTKTFGGSYHDGGQSVQQTSDSGYIIGGWTYPFSTGATDVLLIKTDANGETLWTKTFGGSGVDEGYSVQQTTDSGYVIVGRTSSFGANSLDVWLIKTDATGDTLWTKTFAGYDYQFGYSVQQTYDGGYIITGYTEPFYYGNADVWLIKTDSSGNTLWAKSFGGNDRDGGRSVQQTFDGGHIIAGYTQSFGAGSQDVWLIKTDANGDSLWTKTLGGSGGDEAYSIEQSSDGGYIMTGFTYSVSNGSTDLWLIKTDINGDTMWTKTIPTGVGSAIHQTYDGGYIITGLEYSGSSPDVWLIRVAADVTAIGDSPQALIKDHYLQQNYPNPFNPTTFIQYAIGNKQFVSLKVYNLLAKEIATLVNEEKPAGAYTVEFDASELSTGIYFYQLRAGDLTETKKMILMR